MKLYGFPPSPNTWKVLATAHQMGLPLEVEFVDLTKGAQRKPEYLALNPTGRTPTLVDGDFKLGESSAIMQYLGNQEEDAAVARRRQDTGRHHALAELAPTALEPRRQHADLREPGQEDHEHGRAGPEGVGAGHGACSIRTRRCSTATSGAIPTS